MLTRRQHRWWAAIVLCAGLVQGASAQSGTEDRLLRKVIEAYQVTPFRPRPVTLGPKEKLGQALFFDPVVSGPRGISCATCHVRSKGAGDGLPVAVGLGARGIGQERLPASDAFLVPRNALPFFNRGRDEFRVLFWDGRVQRGPQGRLESPLGDKLPQGFDSLLAVAAVFPMVEPDEMLGRPEEKKRNPAKYHQELLDGIGDDGNNFQQRTLVALNNLVRRLTGPSDTAANPTQQEYRRLLSTAYSGLPVEQAGMAQLGNALAAYIGAAFELQPAPWDHYVLGNNAALAPEQKRGALVFFGKGRCVACHGGTQFSDFQFHGLAVPQLSVGKHGAFLDYGRASATSQAADRFLFRTPPLRNVVLTGPWGHNGMFENLDDVIVHHYNPVPALFKAQQSHPETSGHAGRLLAQRSPLLGEMAPLTAVELKDLVSFLGALSSQTVMSDDAALPRTVPSGDKQFVHR